MTTISSINSNLAAQLAQINISNATGATNTEVAALSSGNRIVQASDDVASLAAGTSLQSQVNTLNTSLTVASQGSSLLQVADGALSQIESILQRQQAIATQAQSGSLSGTQLGFLNQEFQNLTQEIDQLASSTNFNGVNLINGSIAGNATVNTSTATDTTSAATDATAIVTLATALPGNGDSITINGVKVTFSTAAAGTAAAAGEVVVGTDVNHTAANLAAFLNESGDPQFADLHFSNTAGNATVFATYTGGLLSNTVTAATVTASFTTSADVTVNSVVLAAGGANGLGADSTSTIGTVSGSLLVNGGSTAQSTGAPIDTSAIVNNPAFIGSFNSIGTITGSYNNTAGSASFSFTAGAITYTAAATQLYSAGAVVPLTFTGTNTQTGAVAGGSFTLNLNGSALGAAANVSSQDQVNGVAAQLNQALSGITVQQTRTITSFQNGAIVSNNGVQVANLSGASADLTGSNFNNANISSISVAAPTTGSSNATITAVVNGQTYISNSSLGDQIGIGSIIVLQNESNPAQTLTITTGNTAVAGSTNNTAIDLTTASNASAVQAALTSAFGINSSNASLTFQVGSSTSNTIGVSIGSATSSALFNGQSLDVSSQTDAATASNALTTAINTVTSLRANVGALEERFNFASNAIQSASQNESAAESTLLNTDVASESTAFSTSQVQLQAGIAVLAQANQLPQNLLKLIS